MFADQLDVGFLDDPGSLHRTPMTVALSGDFNFLDDDLFGNGAELDDACSVFSESEDYSRMLFEWQQHIGFIGSDLVDFDDPLSASCFKDGQFVPSLGDTTAPKISKEIAALEADDLDSLLAQFEASQAADWLLTDCVPSIEPPLKKSSTEAFNCGVAEECAAGDVIEEVIVEADDEAEYIDVEGIDEEEEEEVVELKTSEDSAPVDQRVVALDHDYCLTVSVDESEVDIEEDNSGDGLYNKIPSYYHETVLLRGNICQSPCPEDVAEEIVVDDENPASPLVVSSAAENGLYCRLPSYIAEGLPPTVKTDCSDKDNVINPSFSQCEAQSTPTSDDTDVVSQSQLPTQADDDSVIDLDALSDEDIKVADDDQDSDRMSIASSDQDDNTTIELAPDSRKTYCADDEYSRYYERKSRRRHRHRRERRTRYNRYSSSRSPTRSRSSRSRSSSSSSVKSRSHSRSWSRSRSRSRSRSTRSNSSRSSSRWEDKEERLREWRRNKMRPIEERRIIYVGNISSGTTRNDLRRRFSMFGPIEEVTVHFRDHGDDYGFVTFLYKVDAFEALAHGNDDRSQPQYDLCFGGRRHFCQSRYADLDGLNAAEDDCFSSPMPQVAKKPVESDFDAMLRAAQASRTSNLQKGHS